MIGQKKKERTGLLASFEHMSEWTEVKFKFFNELWTEVNFSLWTWHTPDSN